MNRRNHEIPIFTVGALSALAAANAFCGLGAMATFLISCLFTLLLRPLLRQLFTDTRPAEAVCCALFTSILGFLFDRYLYCGLEDMRAFLPFLAADAALLCVKDYSEKVRIKKTAPEVLSIAAAIVSVGIAREIAKGSLFGIALWNGIGFLPSLGGALLLFGLFSAFLPAEYGKTTLRSVPFCLAAFFLALLFQLAGAEFSFAEKTLKCALFLLIAAIVLYFAEKRMRYTVPERAKKSALATSAGFFAMALDFVRFF